MSMISKQVEGLRKMVRYHAGIYPDVKEALKDAADTIEHLSAKVNNPYDGWIPVRERLPEDDTEVFVYLFDSQCPYIAWVTDSCWFTEEFQVEKENYPKAWMPLPEPYKAESEDDDD